MAQVTVISREQHTAKRWQRYTSYAFAAKDTVAPLVVQELRRACLSLPVGFVKAEKGFQLVAVQGLLPGQNLWVAPDGRWLGAYVPAAYRSYPFVLASTADGRRVLCVREDSGLVNDREGESFFDEEGKPAQAVQDVLKFLEQVSASAQLTVRMCALLEEHGLIQPWNVKLRTEDAQRSAEGLYRVDEAAFNAVPAGTLDTLHKAGALPLVYCQLLSMQHMQKLGQLANQHAASAASLNDGGDLDLEFMHDGDTIRFS